nr:RNA-directed DNA polymerase, eukaryota [Tanacetum cinerariifolium]
KCSGGLEEHLLADLTSLIDSVTLSNSGDRWVCDLVSDGNFRVKEIRNYIDDLFLPHQAAPTRWIKYIPTKILMTGHRSKSGSLGFFQFGYPLMSKLCWGECSSYLGGLSGTLGIGSFLKNLLQDVRRFLML